MVSNPVSCHNIYGLRWQVILHMSIHVEIEWEIVMWICLYHQDLWQKNLSRQRSGNFFVSVLFAGTLTADETTEDLKGLEFS